MADLDRDFLERLEAAVLARDGERHGDEIRFQCPAHDDETPSADWNTAKRVWTCRACKAGGGAIDLADRLGVPRPGKKAKAKPRVVKRTRFEIRDFDGVLHAVHIRIDHEDGTKSLPWVLPDGTQGLGKRKTSTLPLFGSELLKGAAPGSRVVVTEGEKACMALRSLGVLSVATVTGANIIPDPDVLKVLVGFDAALWADNDDDGRDHMDGVAAGLVALGTKSNVVTWKDAPPKGDAADLVADGGTREDVDALLSAATQWTGPEPGPDPGPEPGPEPAQEPEGADGEEEDAEPRKAKESAQLVAFVKDEMGALLWHTPDGTAYASIPLDGHEEHVQVHGPDFRRLVAMLFYSKRHRVPARNPFEEALHVLGAMAAFEGVEHAVHVRVAGTAGAVWLDLADAERRVVEITATGWRVVADNGLPVKFRRPAGCLPLPVPVAGGNVGLLKPLVNVADEDDFRLVAGWLVSTLHPRGPYGVLALTGEQGSAKSTTCRMLVGLIDPKDAPLRRPPKEDRDLFIASTNGHVVAFNNLSRIREGLSDALAALATESGFVTRELYANDREKRFTERRPVLLNGIPADVVSRGDLADRCTRVCLPAIPDGKRRTEADVLKDFEKVRPLVLGALLDGVSHALAHEAEVDVELPRCADAARWVTAAEPALGWKAGTYLELFKANRDEVGGSMLDGDRLADALVRFAAARVDWTGTSASLLSGLADLEGVKDGKVPVGWPATPRGLSAALDRMAPLLRRQGVTVERLRRQGKDRTRPWHVQKVGNEPSAPSAPSANGPGGGFAADGPPPTVRQPSADRPPENPPAERKADGRTERTVDSDPLLRFDFGANADPPPEPGAPAGNGDVHRCACGCELPREAVARGESACWNCRTLGVGRAGGSR